MKALSVIALLSVAAIGGTIIGLGFHTSYGVNIRNDPAHLLYCLELEKARLDDKYQHISGYMDKMRWTYCSSWGLSSKPIR